MNIDVPWEDLMSDLESLRADLRTESARAVELLVDTAAATARSTHGYSDRSGSLTQSTQNAGVVEGPGGDIVGTLGFGAKSRSTGKYPGGYAYGLVQEFGNKAGTVKGTRFITKAIETLNEQPLEDAIRRAVAKSKFFQVVG